MGDFNDPFMRNRDAPVQGRAKAQNRANVLQLKLMAQNHPTGLTANLLKLFEPRQPLEYKPPLEKKKPLPYTGMAQFATHFASPCDPEYAPPVKKAETPTERRARIQKIRLEKGAEKAAEELEKYDPHKDPNVTGDPYKTLFVARLNYETTEHMIKREFEAYGPIKRVRLITDEETNKPRGYGFIEYMHTRDMKTAYKQADGRKLDNRRVLVDVERGRTVPNWRPRRLGGGLGSTRIGGEDLNQKNSGREQQQIASGGHLRSEEPRVREDRHVDRDREKSRDRGRERDREREKSHDRLRDKDPREDRHHRHRDRDSTRDRDRDKERDRGRDRDSRRGRDRDRDRGRDHDYERDRDRPHDRKRDRDRDYDRASHGGDRGHTHDRDGEYDRASDEGDRGHTHDRDGDYDQIEPMHDRERSITRDKDLEPGEHEYSREWYDERVKHGHGHGHGHEHDYDQNDEHYDHLQPHGPSETEHDGQRVNRHEPEYYDDQYGKVQGGYRGHYEHEDPGGYRGHYEHEDPEAREEGEAVAEHDYAAIKKIPPS